MLILIVNDVVHKLKRMEEGWVTNIQLSDKECDAINDILHDRFQAYVEV